MFEPENSYDNPLVIMVKRYKDKEKRWMQEKFDLNNRIESLKEELNAIRRYILSDKTATSLIHDAAISQQIPIPAFIRACNTLIGDNEDGQKV